MRKSYNSNYALVLPDFTTKIRCSANGYLDTLFTVSQSGNIVANLQQRAIYNNTLTVNAFNTDSVKYIGASMTLKYKGNASITVSRTPQNIPLLYTPLSWETFKVTKSINDALPIQLLAVIDQAITFNAANTSVLLKRNGNYTEIQFAQFGDSIVFEEEEQLLKLYTLRHNDEVTLIQKSLSPLPVELLYLTANTVENQYINLSWATATESNSSLFEVERSYDGQYFTPINTVPAAGNSNSLKYYQTDDYKAQIGTNYYRLKIVDLNGSFYYSDIVNAYLSPNNEISIYPNPADDLLYIDSKITNPILVKITNELGQIIYQQTEMIEKINTKSFANGIYFIQVISEGRVVVKNKFVVQHK